MNEHSVSQQSSRLCWLLKILTTLVVVVWIVWGGQLKLVSNPKLPNLDEDKLVIAKMYQITSPVLDRARQSNRQYRPHQYYQDRRTIELADLKLDHPGETLPNGKTLAENAIGTLETQLEDSRRFGCRSYVERDAFDREAQAEVVKYQKWLALNLPKPDNAKYWQSTVKAIRAGGLNWLWTFYLRGIPLSLILFLIRMKQRKGILATILADKKAFILALLFWPYLVWKYPHNVIREVIVEAELRRLGRFFRPLTAREQTLVRKVANSKAYTSWRRSHHHTNRGKFQRGLIVAILGTLLVSLFATASPTKSVRTHSAPQGAIVVIQTDRAGPSGYTNAINDDTGQSSGFTDSAILPRIVDLELVVVLWSILTTYRAKLPNPVKKITHVPLRQSVSVTVWN